MSRLSANRRNHRRAEGGLSPLHRALGLGWIALSLLPDLGIQLRQQSWICGPPELDIETFTISSQIVVDPDDGVLYNVVDVVRGDRSRIKVLISPDAGVTWSHPIKIARDLSIRVRHPNTGHRIRVGDLVPDAAIDPRNGDVYVVWDDARFSNMRYEQIALSRSNDGGRTWSRPVRVNRPKHPRVHAIDRGERGRNDRGQPL